ncbi:L-Aspartase-like protein [Ganoderma leucocontextum]|nr:L-Aspartase-like protein [Ganoderma leucocontextum]
MAAIRQQCILTPLAAIDCDTTTIVPDEYFKKLVSFLIVCLDMRSSVASRSPSPDTLVKLGHLLLDDTLATESVDEEKNGQVEFLGPQVEDVLSAFTAITIECNSTTDNPLIDGETGEVHHSGNFQAMSTRLAMHHIGKLLFAQCTELLNPSMNRGLPPNLAANDPSHNFFAKGVSAEMYNQAVNSLALISARATLNSLEVLSIPTSSFLCVLCQALDLRAMQHEFELEVDDILREQIAHSFGRHLADADLGEFFSVLARHVRRSLETSSTMDATHRMRAVAAATATPIVDFYRPPAAKWSRAVYEFVRTTLGIRMHGVGNLLDFKDGPSVEYPTIGQASRPGREDSRRLPRPSYLP